MSFELRTYKLPADVDIEVRAEGGRITMRGYAYVFNRYSQNLGGFVEQVAPGAGAKSIAEHDIRALFNHDPNFVLGRMGSGTLRMGEDNTGGFYEIDLPDTSIGRDVAESLRRKDITGSSFGFRTIEDDWGESGEGFPLRTLKAFAIRDVGPVTFPAYPDTSAALKRLAKSRSLDMEKVEAAAAANELRSLIFPQENEAHEDSENRIFIPRTRGIR